MRVDTGWPRHLSGCVPGCPPASVAAAAGAARRRRCCRASARGFAPCCRADRKHFRQLCDLRRGAGPQCLPVASSQLSAIAAGVPLTCHPEHQTISATGRLVAALDLHLQGPHLSRLPPTALSEDLLLRRSAWFPFSPLFRLSSSLRLRCTYRQESQH